LLVLELILLVFATFLSIAIYAYNIVGETKWYDLALAIFMGSLCPMAIFDNCEAIFKSVIIPLTKGRLLYIVPLLFGLLTLSRLTKYRWLARYPVALMGGVGSGVLVGMTIRSDILNNIKFTFEGLVNLEPDPAAAILAVVMAFGIIIYFMYSRKFTDPFYVKYKWLARFGSICLYATLGYWFGFMFKDNALDRSLTRFWVTILWRTVATLLAQFGITI